MRLGRACASDAPVGNGACWDAPACTAWLQPWVSPHSWLAPGLPTLICPRFVITQRLHLRCLQVLRYLEAFAAAFDLASVVETCTQVVAVRLPAALAGGGAAAGADSSLGQQQQQQQWEVTLRRAGSSSTSSGGGSASGSTGSSGGAQADAEEVAGFEAVVVCNGHYSEPRVPSFPGQSLFPGRQMHSHNYRTAAPFAGQTGGWKGVGMDTEDGGLAGGLGVGEGGNKWLN